MAVTEAFSPCYLEGRQGVELKSLDRIF